MLIVLGFLFSTQYLVFCIPHAPGVRTKPLPFGGKCNKPAPGVLINFVGCAGVRWDLLPSLIRFRLSARRCRRSYRWLLRLTPVVGGAVTINTSNNVGARKLSPYFCRVPKCSTSAQYHSLFFQYATAVCNAVVNSSLPTSDVHTISVIALSVLLLLIGHGTTIFGFCVRSCHSHISPCCHASLRACVRSWWWWSSSAWSQFSARERVHRRSRPRRIRGRARRLCAGEGDRGVHQSG